MTSNDVSARARSGCHDALGTPRSTTASASWSARVCASSSTRAREGGRSAPSPPAGTTRRPGEAGSLRCSMASASTPASAVSQSRTPGPLGCGRPSAAGMSPARSTRRAPPGAEAASRPRDAATTVVPLPPLTDQQQVSTLTPEGRRPSRCRTMGQKSSSTRSGGRSGQHSGCSRPQQGADRTDRVGAGGVWAPGGLHRLQSGWNGRSPFGGFDSRPPPRSGSPASTAILKSGSEQVIRTRSRMARVRLALTATP